jgi:hypothetical protein
MNAEPTTPETHGVSPKVPTQAVVTVITFAITYFGIELSPELSGAISTILGIFGGVIAKPGDVR